MKTVNNNDGFRWAAGLVLSMAVLVTGVAVVGNTEGCRRANERYEKNCRRRQRIHFEIWKAKNNNPNITFEDWNAL